jgi:hypothetical protein
VPMPSDDTRPMPVMTTRLLKRPPWNPAGDPKVSGYPFLPLACESM